jgi:hypothetical protein
MISSRPDSARGASARGFAVLAVGALVLPGCATVAGALRRTESAPAPAAAAPAVMPSDTLPITPPPSPSVEPEPAPPPRREATATTPRAVRPAAGLSTTIHRRALAARGTRIVVSLGARTLWLMKDNAVLFRAPVAIGMTKGFSYKGRRWDFRTPVGQRSVIGKAKDPIWIAPDWHYYEKVARRGLVPVRVEPGRKTMLADGTHIEIRDGQVGRVNQFGNFWPFTVGNEIIFDGKIFIPPTSTAQRRIPGILGPFKLDMGEGYLIHGTDRETSIGEAVSHGCVRMYNDDVTKLHALVPVGTAVYIF